MPGGWTVTASGTNREAIAADGQNADLLPARPSSAVPVRTVWLLSVFDDDVVNVSFLRAMEFELDMQPDVGQSVPVTPPMISMQMPPTPTRPQTTRAHDGEPNVEQES